MYTCTNLYPVLGTVGIEFLLTVKSFRSINIEASFISLGTGTTAVLSMRLADNVHILHGSLKSPNTFTEASCHSSVGRFTVRSPARL